MSRNKPNPVKLTPTKKGKSPVTSPPSAEGTPTKKLEKSRKTIITNNKTPKHPSQAIQKKRKKPREILRMGNKCFLISRQILREIREYRNFTNHVVARAPFARLVREIMMEFMSDSRIQTEALECLQEASEAYVTQYLEDSNCCAAHSRRITLMPKDMELVKYLRGSNL